MAFPVIPNWVYAPRGAGSAPGSAASSSRDDGKLFVTVLPICSLMISLQQRPYLLLLCCSLHTILNGFLLPVHSSGDSSSNGARCVHQVCAVLCLQRDPLDLPLPELVVCGGELPIENVQFRLTAARSTSVSRYTCFPVNELRTIPRQCSLLYDAHLLRDRFPSCNDYCPRHTADYRCDGALEIATL